MKEKKKQYNEKCLKTNQQTPKSQEGNPKAASTLCHVKHQANNRSDRKQTETVAEDNRTRRKTATRA